MSGMKCDACIANTYGFPTCKGMIEMKFLLSNDIIQKLILYSVKACECNADGSTSLQCKDDGNCECNKYITGAKCNQCVEEHFNFPTCSSK